MIAAILAVVVATFGVQSAAMGEGWSGTAAA